MNAKDALAVGRMLSCRLAPYFRTQIMSLRPHESPGYGTCGVTADEILIYDPVEILKWKKEELAAVLIHESMHILRNHAGRCEALKADHDLFNVAADAEINDDCMAMDLSLPGTPVMPSQFGLPDGLTAEEYYLALVQQAAQKDSPDAPAGQGAAQTVLERNRQGSGQKKPQKGIGEGKCGGCAGNPGPGEQKASEGTEGRTEREKERTRRAVAAAIREAAQRGKGDVPAGMARWAGEIMQAPKVPWQQRLSRAVRRGVAYRPGAVDLTYGKIGRRQAGLGFGTGRPILPALHAPCPRVGVVVDTSGSMGTTEIEMCLRELRGVLKAVGADVEFASADASVQTQGKIRDVRKASFRGGGGTDFRPAMRAMAQRKPRIDVLVYMTDGYGTAPSAPPPYRTIWLLIGRSHKPAEWGEAVEVET